MVDETQQPAADAEPSAESQTDESPKAKIKTDELLSEFSRLGQAIADAVKAAWASDERKKLEEDLNRGLASVVDSIEEAVDKLGKNEQTKQVLGRAEEMAESVGKKVRESEVTADVAEGLRAGLTTLTEQLHKLTKDLGKSETAKSSTAEDIPVSDGDEAKPADEA